MNATCEFMNSKIDDFLLGIAEATNVLISLQLEEGINLALKTLCDNLDVDSSFVFVNHENEQGERLTSLKYFSASEMVISRVKHNQNVRIVDLGMVGDRLAEGNSYQLIFSKSDGKLQEHMGLDSTKSVALFPIMANEVFWGIMGLASFHEERQWTESEKALLLSLANTIGGAIEREELEDNLELKVKQRTEELEDSQLRFQLAIEGTQNGIWDWEPQKNRIFWSQNMYDNLGYEREDLSDLIDGFYDLIHPEERKEAKRRFDNYLDYKIPYIMEFRLRKKDGSYRWFKSTCKAVWNEEGQAIRVVGSHADIHERKTYTDLLAKQEQKFRTIIRDDPNALFLVNGKGGILLHSNRSVEIFGYQPDELMSMSLTELLPSDRREEHAKHLKKYFANPRTRVMGKGMKLKGRKKNGMLFWIEVGLSPVSLEGETLVMAVVTDVSEKRDAEIKLEESYRQINNLINNLPGIVYRCRNDENWTMDYISPACEQITGYKQEDFYGYPSNMNYAELIIPEEREEVWEQVQESILRKVPFRVTYRICDKSNVQKWIWEQGIAVFDDQGDVLGLEGCIFDITPIIKNQERVNQAIYATEDRERKRIAVDLHDGVQQILGVSSLNIKHLEDEIYKLSESAQKHFRKGLKYLSQGIKESRNIAHRIMPKEIEQLGLNHAIEELLMELRSNKGIETKYYSNVEEGLETEIELSLYRVVQESFNNIIKYAKSTKVSVQLISTKEEIQLMIEDNGVGFDKNKIDLYREGFGLMGMKNRIVSLSGQLSIDSRPGRGTCIVAWIPRK